MDDDTQIGYWRDFVKTRYTLDNYHSEIGKVQITFLAFALCSKESILTKIWIQRGQIGNYGALVFAKVLTQNKTLTILTLANDTINNQGCHALIKALAYHNDTLKEFRFDGQD